MQYETFPMMTGSEPMRCHVSKLVEPVAISMPSEVSLYWKEVVREGVYRDVRLRVIEKVSEYTHAPRCTRIVITSKMDCIHRRVVDYQEVNTVEGDGAPRQSAPRQSAPRQCAPRQCAPRQSAPR